MVKLTSFACGLPHVKIRDIASLLGLLMSCYKALGPVTRIMTRVNYSWVHSSLASGGWDAYAAYPATCRRELEFRIKNLVNLNGFSFSASKSESQFEIEIAGGASDQRLYAFQYEDSVETIARRLFTRQEVKESSTYREMLVLHEIYCSPDAARLAKCRIRHLTDNKAVEFIFKSGSKNPRIHKRVVDIFLSCHSHQISLTVSWRSRDDPLLQISDSGSRNFDGSSFSLDFSSSSILMEACSHVNLTIDAMAQSWNKNLPRYFSRFKDPLAIGQNFFAQRLDMTEGYYVFPPPRVVVARLLHLRKFRASGVLVLPLWPSCSFFNFVFPDGKHPGSWALSLLRFRPEGFHYDPCFKSYTFKKSPSFDIVAIHFSFLQCEWNCFNVSRVDSRLCLDWGCYTCTGP